MNNLTVRGITIRDSPMFHIVSQGGSHKRFSNLSLLSGCGFATAPNTDGFNVGGDDIIVSNSHVRNGDDCLPFGGSNLLAERVTCECGNSPGLYMDASTNITYRHHTSLRTCKQRLRLSQLQLHLLQCALLRLHLRPWKHRKT